MALRALSAAVALALFFATVWYFQEPGVLGICALISFRCAYEYSRLTFVKQGAPNHLRWSFVCLAMLLYGATVWAEEYALAVLAVTSILYLSMALVQVRSRSDLREAISLQSTGLLGFVYAGVFPALATKTVQLEGGVLWLYGLFLIVFLGDTMAYLCGRAFGRRKLLPSVSPKKTIEGAVGGLLGSVLGGLIMGLFLTPQIDLWQLLPTALVAGLFGQVGDLFESLIKRLADEKDSGRLMPGHGGALDRVDGILFAAPIYYVLVRFFLG